MLLKKKLQQVHTNEQGQETFGEVPPCPPMTLVILLLLILQDRIGPTARQGPLIFWGKTHQAFL